MKVNASGREHLDDAGKRAPVEAAENITAGEAPTLRIECRERKSGRGDGEVGRWGAVVPDTEPVENCAKRFLLCENRLTDLWREAVQLDLDRAVLDWLSCGCPEDHFAG
jgi:hypothetical protein